MKKLVILFMGTLIGFWAIAQNNQAFKKLKSGFPVQINAKSDQILFDQSNNISGNGFATQDFETNNDAYDCQIADDFTVPSGETWDLNYIWAPFFTSDTVNADPIELMNVYIYQNSAADTPGTLINEFLSVPCNFKDYWAYIPLPQTVSLGEGTYWISLQPRYNYSDGGVTYCVGNNSNNGFQFMWKNPGDGFGDGYTTWTSGSTVFSATENDITMVLLNSTPNNVTFNVTLNGDPLEGATLKVFNEEYTTDENGQVNVQLYTSSYEVEVTSDCIEPLVVDVDINQDMEVNLQTQPKDFTATFTVIDENNTPVSGATIMINSEELTTNSVGIVQTDLPCGTYPFTAAKEGYQVCQDTLIVEGSDVSKTITLRPGSAVNSVYSNIKIYPNPSEKFFYIENVKNSTIIISDINGKVIKQFEAEKDKQYINTSNWQKGAYIITIKTGNETTVFNLVVK